MTLQEIRNKVCKEFDRRNLKSNTRYKALDKIVSYIKEYHNGNLSVLHTSKSDFKSQYENYKNSIGQAFSSAESSAINEIYNQFDSFSGFKSYTIPVQPDEIIDVSAEIGLDTLLNPKNFEQVSNLNESLIPDTPGLYARWIKGQVPDPL